MPVRIFTGTSISALAGTNLITAQSEDLIIIPTSALYATTGAGSDVIGVAGGASSVRIVVQGSVIGAERAVDLFGVLGNNSLTVAATGSVMSNESNAVSISGTSATITNAGLIQGPGASSNFFPVFSSAIVTQLVNSGSILGSGGVITVAITSTGGGTLINSGLISRGAAEAGVAVDFDAALSNDILWNTGTIVGDINLGGGNDLYQGSGQVTGSIGVTGGEAGDDTVIGGAFDDTIIDTLGGNWLAGGDGDDTITIGGTLSNGAIDHVFGGISGGADTSTNDHLRVEGEPGGSGVNIFLANGYVANVANTDVIAYFTGIEHATGTFFADAIFGSAAANRIEGGDLGDWMVGNGGADHFVFRFASHADAGDQIRDFRRSEADRIDLSVIDANTTIAGNDAFIFRTTRTSNAAGEAVVINFGNSARVDLYTNADNIVDGTFIVVYGEAGVTSLLANDFIL